MKIFITKISNTKVMHSCRYLEKRLLIRRIGILAILVSPCILDFKSNWPMVLTFFLATIMIFSHSLTTN
ncbi:hypothetical protein T4D_11656 [Trichinella pseudospiralis]|uniref:Uncharacterized protein n=1 Tax=Trichinella pseudospiralis TaxID=6337 RepID=A0A0V1FMT0_TRIPS|nr:hypothetical protein T4D_11656 [Trichinella pseudospiralis]